MNKKALILLIILTIPAYTFLQPHATMEKALVTNPSVATASYSNHPIVVQSIGNNKGITTQAYKAPWEPKILWDNHTQTWWYAYKYSEMISDLASEYGANVTIDNNVLFNETDLSQYDLIIIPASPENLTENEINALKTYLENNGTLLLMGDRSSYYPKYLNATTLPFGVGWYNTTIYDDTNHDFKSYYPIVHVWGNNTVARYITGNYKNMNVTAPTFKTSGCPIVITGDNTTTKIYIIGIGDDDTYTDANISDGDVIYFAAVDLPSGGRFIASSGASGFQNYYNYGSYGNNSYIALRMISWLLSEGLQITNVSVPNGLEINSEGDIGFIVKNNLDSVARNVSVAIEYTGGIQVLNSSQEINIGDLAAGETKILHWHIKALNQSSVRVVLKAWSNNARGYSVAEEFETKGVLEVSTSVSPMYVMVPNNVALNVNVTNPLASNTNTTMNVTIMVTFPMNTTHFLYEYENITLNAGESYLKEVNISTENATIAGEVQITVTVSSNNLGTFKASDHFYVFTRYVALFYEHDVGYYKHFRFEDFLNNVSDYLDVFAMSDMLNSEIMSLTKLVILPEPDHPMTNEELNLLENFMDNGGKIIVIGDWYSYFDPDNLNPLTQNYGIAWNDGEVMDDAINLNNISYIPILSTFAINPYAAYLKKGVESIIFHGSTYLTITGSNVYPIVLGNPTSYAVDSNKNPVGINGTDIITFAVAELPNGGLMIASGSSYIFRSDGKYASYYEHNKPFLENIVDLLFKGDFIKDTEPPVINLSTNLKNYSCVHKQFSLSWTASDNVEVSAIKIYVNGELLTTLPGTATSYSFNLEDGVYAIKVVAVDWVGYTDSFTITLIVDDVPPNITITSPADGSIVGESTVTLTWTVDDPAVPLVGHYELYVDGELVNGSISGDATSYTLTGLGEGTHNITLVVVSCLTSSSASIFIKVDLSGPNIVYSPANGSTVFAPFNITFNATDSSGLNRYEILIDGAIVDAGSLSGTSATISYHVGSLSPGMHTVTIRAYDSLGHMSEETFVINVKVPSGAPGTLYIGGATAIIIAIIALYLFLRRRG